MHYYVAMNLQFNLKQNTRLFLRDPEQTATGKLIVRQSMRLIAGVGYEMFTFKKLSEEIGSTEATIYRYFENKHKLLIYLLDYYWALLEYQVIFETNHMKTPADKIKKIIDLLVWEDNPQPDYIDFDIAPLYHIAIAEGCKTYLNKSVDEHNKEKFYQPYKDLCALIADIFTEYNPGYAFAKSLASTVVEMSHMQYYFMKHLPRLCDFTTEGGVKQIEVFLETLVFSALDNKN